MELKCSVIDLMNAHVHGIVKYIVVTLYNVYNLIVDK